MASRKAPSTLRESTVTKVRKLDLSGNDTRPKGAKAREREAEREVGATHIDERRRGEEITRARERGREGELGATHTREREGEESRARAREKEAVKRRTHASERERRAEHARERKRP